MIKFQQSQALTSHFESFWSTVVDVVVQYIPGLSTICRVMKEKMMKTI